MKKEMDVLKSQLQLFLNQNCKIHPNTLKQLNKKLQNQQIIHNNTTNNNTTTNNNIEKQEIKQDIRQNLNVYKNKNICVEKINHYHQHFTNIQIVGFGKENVDDIFSDQCEKFILSKKINSLNTLIEAVHYGKLAPQCHNIIITSVSNNIAYIFDEKKQQFTAIDKNDMLDELIEIRTNDLQDMFDKHKESLSPFSRNILETFFKRVEEKRFSEKEEKEVKLICYNSLNYLLKKYKEEHDIKT